MNGQSIPTSVIKQTTKLLLVRLILAMT